jgi:hypothetical protein
MEASETADTAAPDDGQPLTVEQMLAQIQADQRAHRQEVAHLREELASSRAPAPATTVTVQSAEERQKARLTEMAGSAYYCPGCGTLYDYPRACEGTREGKHPPIEVVSTDEVKGDPEKHTAAPPSPVL